MAIKISNKSIKANSSYNSFSAIIRKLINIRPWL